MQTCDWTMNASISTVEFDSQCVLTNHARSAACIMAMEVLVLSRSLSPCLHLTLLTISFSVPCMNSHNITITVRKSILTHLSCEGHLVLCHNSVIMIDCHNHTMSYCIVHRAITITSRCNNFSPIRPSRCYVRVAVIH